jgi:phage portal protein BeeE
MGLIDRIFGKAQLPAPSTPAMGPLDASLVTRQEDTLADFRDVAKYDFLSKYVRGMALDLALYNANNLSAVPLRLYTSRPQVVRGAKRRVDPLAARRLRSFQAVGTKAVQRAERAGDVFEVLDDPMLDLLCKPDPSTTASAWNVLRFINKQLYGDALLLTIQGSSGTPVALPNLQPQWASVQPDKEARIAGWFYGRDEVSREQYEADQVFQQKWSDNPNTIYRGLGWLETAIRELEIEDRALAAELTRWKNGGYPEGVLSFKNAKNQDQLNQAMDAFHRMLRKSRRQGGVIATSESTYTPLSVAQEMNYVPGLELIERRLLNRAGIPTTLYFMSDSNRASAIAGDSAYATNTLTPALVIDAEQWTEWLAPRFGQDPAEVWFAYDAVGQVDRDALNAQISATVPIGVMTPNEGRALLGLPPHTEESADLLLVGGVPLESLADGAVAGGGGIFGPPSLFGADPVAQANEQGEVGASVADVSLNGAQVQQLISIAQQVAAGLLPKDTGVAAALAAFPGIPAQRIRDIFDPIVEGNAPVEGEVPEAEEATVKGLDWGEDDPFGDCGHDHDHETKADEGPIDELPDELRRKFEAVLRGYFVLVATSVRRNGPDADLRPLDLELEQALEPLITEAVRGGADAGLEAIGVSTDFFEVSPDQALGVVRSRSSLLIEQIRGTTEDAIRRTLDEGLEAGMTTDEISIAIQDRVSDASPHRAETIARTEMANAFTEGNLAAWKEAGVASKRWALAPNACSLCRKLVATVGKGGARTSKAIPLAEPFAVPGDLIIGDDGKRFTVRTVVMGPPLHPNDRCVVIAELGDFNAEGVGE